MTDKQARAEMAAAVELYRLGRIDITGLDGVLQVASELVDGGPARGLQLIAETVPLAILAELYRSEVR
jgi:hypothetical protein